MERSAREVLLAMKSMARRSPPGYWSRLYQTMKPEFENELKVVFNHPKFLYADKVNPPDIVAEEATFDLVESLPPERLSEVIVTKL